MQQVSETNISETYCILKKQKAAQNINWLTLNIRFESGEKAIVSLFLFCK